MGPTFVDLCEMAQRLLDRINPIRKLFFILYLEFQSPTLFITITLVNECNTNKGGKAGRRKNKQEEQASSVQNVILKGKRINTKELKLRVLLSNYRFDHESCNNIILMRHVT